MSEPFDPFSYDEDDDIDQNYNPAPSTPNSKSHGFSPSQDDTSKASKTGTDDTSKTTNAARKRVQHQQQGNNDHARVYHSKLEELPLSLSRSTSNASNRLPPKLNIKLFYHEEVSSSSIAQKDGAGNDASGESLSRLFVTGTVMAQVESTDSNQNAPFCLQFSGAPHVKIKCHSHCVLIDETTSRFVTFSSQQSPSVNSKDNVHQPITCKVDIPMRELEPVPIATYSIENVLTQNMPILVQTKATIRNNNHINICRIGIQIRSNLNNVGDLYDFTILLSIPTTLKQHTVKITRGDNGQIDEMKQIATWKIGHLGHGKSSLVSIEAELDSILSDMMESYNLNEDQEQLSEVEDKIEFPVLVRLSSKEDQISDVKLSCVALEDVPASIGVQFTKSFRLLHRVCKGNV